MFAMGPAFFGRGVAALALSGTFPAATVGTAYDQYLTISGGTTPYSLTGGTGVASGTLPAGLSLSISGSQLHLSGTPTTAATSAFTVSVSDSASNIATSSQSVMVAAATGYNSLVASMAPDLWWKFEEVSGTAVVDSSAGATYPGTLAATGGQTFATSGVSISAPSGFSGLLKGINFNAFTPASYDATTANVPAGILGGGSGSWAVVLTYAAAISATSNQYLVSRVNNAAILAQFVANAVEFFAIGYSGSDPRPGSQLTVASSDTSPHQIAYRYDAAASGGPRWAGFLDGAKVFDVARTFSLTGTTHLYVNSDSASSFQNKMFDLQCYARAPSDAELAALWATRNSP